LRPAAPLNAAHLLAPASVPVNRQAVATQEPDSPTENTLLFWYLKHGRSPALDVGINLQRNEQCYFTCKADCYESRRVRVKMRARLGQGPAAGNLGDDVLPIAGTEQVPAYVDSGRLYLTNKRVIFRGSHKNTTIRMSRILDFSTFGKGIEIHKETGSPLFLAFEENVDAFSMMLSQVIASHQRPSNGHVPQLSDRR
jgi:hypothetical protein